MVGKTDRSNPTVQAGKGDERIRTAVPSLGTDSAYEGRSRRTITCVGLRLTEVEAPA